MAIEGIRPTDDNEQLQQVQSVGKSSHPEMHDEGVRLIAYLLSMIAFNGSGIDNFLLPALTHAQQIQEGATSLYVILTLDPKALSDGQLADDLNKFGNGWQQLQLLMKNPKTPADIRQYITRLTRTKPWAAKWQKLYTDVQNLQAAQDRGDTKGANQILKEIKGVDIPSLQKGKLKTDPETDQLAYQAETKESQTFMQVTSGIAQVWYQAANRIVYNIDSLTTLASQVTKKFGTSVLTEIRRIVS